MLDHFFLLLFPQEFWISKNIGHPISGSGGKKTVKRYLKSEQTHRRTHKSTDRRTFWLIESIGRGQMLWKLIIWPYWQLWHTNRRTWQLYDQHGPEGQVGVYFKVWRYIFITVFGKKLQFCIVVIIWIFWTHTLSFHPCSNMEKSGFAEDIKNFGFQQEMLNHALSQTM